MEACHVYASGAIRQALSSSPDPLIIRIPVFSFVSLYSEPAGPIVAPAVVTWLGSATRGHAPTPLRPGSLRPAKSDVHPGCPWQR